MTDFRRDPFWVQTFTAALGGLIQAGAAAPSGPPPEVSEASEGALTELSPSEGASELARDKPAGETSLVQSSDAPAVAPEMKLDDYRAALVKEAADIADTAYLMLRPLTGKRARTIDEENAQPGRMDPRNIGNVVAEGQSKNL